MKHFLYITLSTFLIACSYDDAAPTPEKTLPSVDLDQMSGNVILPAGTLLLLEDNKYKVKVQYTDLDTGDRITEKWHAVPLKESVHLIIPSASKYRNVLTAKEKIPAT